jgi:uncharacterized membrane protein
MKKKSFAPYIILTLAFIGITIAFYDSFSVYTGRLLWCPSPIDGCNTVAYSSFARLFNVPLGYLGLIFYLTMFAFAALLAYDPFSRGLRLGTSLLAALGVLLSICFQYIEITLIHAFCIYCLISFILTLLLFIYLIAHFRAMRRPAFSRKQN